MGSEPKCSLTTCLATRFLRLKEVMLTPKCAQDWLDIILDTMLNQAPWLSPSSSSPSSSSATSHERKRETGFWPRLFLTPNACGKEKPDEWIVSQGNKALMIFEESVGVEVKRRGLEHLGTWNASIQSNKFDGV